MMNTLIFKRTCIEREVRAMKDMKELKEFIDYINTSDLYLWFKESFLEVWKTEMNNKTMWVDYSSVIRAISYDIETKTLFIQFTSDKQYAYYNVPVDVFVCACFSDFIRNNTEIPKDRASVSLGQWFNDIVKGYFDYTLLN